ncbi:MAG TPA: nucleotidyltransferase family protein [Hyphomicrobiaceae bacterium]|nr:nucleotidyltransferase family protein [Hyphomicrobiaceae bacterium]
MSSVAAVLLAAGSARRFAGGAKLFAEIDGEPLVLHAARALAASRCERLVVVTGPEADRVKAALAALPRLTPELVHNDRHAEGIGGSIAAGVRALPRTATAVLIVQADMPGLTSTLVDGLIGLQEERAALIGIAPVVFPTLADGRQRSPVLWPARFRDKLEALTGDQGAKGLIAAARGETAPLLVDDPRLIADIDTIEELEAYRAGKA